jgi:hypothetical protein
MQHAIYSRKITIVVLLKYDPIITIVLIYLTDSIVEGQD